MIEACSSCRFPADVSVLSEDFSVTLDHLNKMADEHWEVDVSALSLINALINDSQLDPAQLAELDQYHATISDSGARFAYRIGETRDFIEGAIKSTEEIDCALSGLDLCQQCPRVIRMTARALQLRQLVDPRP